MYIFLVFFAGKGVMFRTLGYLPCFVPFSFFFSCKKIVPFVEGEKIVLTSHTVAGYDTAYSSSRKACRNYSTESVKMSLVYTRWYFFVVYRPEKSFRKYSRAQIHVLHITTRIRIYSYV